VAYSVIDTMMTGHASPADLAAMGLGASVYSSVFLALTGVVSALNPIIAHHYGARRWDAIGPSYVQGLWLALMLSLVGMPLLAFPGPWLARLGADPAVEALATQYLRLLSLGLPAALMFRATYALNVAISRPKVIMAIQVAGLVLKVALNDVLIFGRFGLPRLGAVGCGLASFIVYWVLCLMAFGYTHFDERYRRYAIGRAAPRGEALAEHLRLGVPIGLAYALETTSFTFMSLLIARLGTGVQGGHQIIANLAGIAYQVPLALSVATATLTAQALGAGEPRRARHAAFTGIRTAVAAAVVTSAAFWTFRRGILSLYTADAAVTAVALSLIGYMVAFHVFDAFQSTVNFVLRAYRVVVAPMLVYAVALWSLGLGGGYVLAFHGVFGEPRGVAGMWLMQAIALGLTSGLLLGLYLWVLRQDRPAAGKRSG
jgi:MATE family multidrug resistance protein